MLQNAMHKAKGRISLLMLASKLKRLSRHGGSTAVDYGWIKLLYTNDGDKQELHYHQNCLAWYNNDLAVFKEYVRSGDTVVDVGANMGFVTAILARLVGSEGKIYAFEPTAATYQKLLNTIELNDLTMVEPVNLGLGADDAFQELYQVDRASGHNTVVKNSADQVSLGRIQITSLDRFMENRPDRIALIKIDTEGYESQVLRGATEVITKHRPVIYLELCNDYRESSLEAIHLLRSLDYRLPDDVEAKMMSNGTNFIALYSRGE